jgi:hypothetical protein
MKADQLSAWDKATENFAVMATASTQTAAYVAAEARTGSRYAVVISQLPPMAAGAEGGAYLISLIQPWQASMVFTVFPDEQIHGDYIVEKMCKDRKHGGDLAAVVMAVNTAIKKATEAGVIV